MIKKGQIVTLNDNIEYFILSEAVYNNNKYFYMTSLEDKSKVMICREDNGKLVAINDKETIANLVLLFDKDIQTSF